MRFKSCAIVKTLRRLQRCGHGLPTVMLRAMMVPSIGEIITVVEKIRFRLLQRAFAGFHLSFRGIILRNCLLRLRFHLSQLGAATHDSSFAWAVVELAKIRLILGIDSLQW